MIYVILVLERNQVRPRKPKTEVYYKCKGKYQLVGRKYATCKDGKWSYPPPICVKSGCIPPDVDDTLLKARYFFDGAVMSFACPSGYELRGPRSIFCDGRTWNGGPPICIGIIYICIYIYIYIYI
ncbi:hypothetical protein LSH36_255g03022 [Paralvinella palmiformis]|uniref:Sushi domain-containing protein n=1 Tax=Paralvinella palmiformis TaxID=53620 RepID=A0AAD9JKW9_9ANNE|nr:hypothetical protein LSH36_255g03022 [Paralvinella palmiformis]